MDKFKNKYRIPSARAQWWDYGNNGFYFITICTADREYLFGDIKDNKMVLSDIGNIVQQEWEKSFEIRAELFCDVYVIMPNHIHGIIQIDKNGPDVKPATATVETHGRASLQTQMQPQSQSESQPQSKNYGIAYRTPKSISSFVAGFKSSATKRINEYRNTPKSLVWQSRFYDHIIRKQDEYIRIKQYIETNTCNWEKDKLYNV